MSRSDGRPSGSPPEEGPWLVPCMMISRGRLMLPGPDGPEPASPLSGGSFDLFDLTDRLMADYRRVYVVDLDGIEDDRPQLDYLQEIVRGGDIWVDAGVRTADQAIDVLVAGAQRAVLSSAFLRSEKELRRAWRLSSDVVFEIEVRGGAVNSREEAWSGLSPLSLAEAVRAIGPQEILLSCRESPTDWEMARGVSRTGPVWIDGSFEPIDVSRVTASGAAGAIFHLHQFLKTYEPSGTA